MREDVRQSHPCPLCHQKPTWLGGICNDCAISKDIWCPCGVKPPYGEAKTPIPGDIVVERCMRCGYLIKEIYEAMKENDDAALDRILERMESK